MMDLDPQTMQLIDEFIMEIRRQVEDKAVSAFLSGISDYTDPTDPTLSTINPGALPLSNAEPASIVYGAPGDGAPGAGTGISRDTHNHPLDPAVGGDLSGSLPNPVVAQIQGVPVGTTDPLIGQALIYDGDSYEPTDLPSSAHVIQDEGVPLTHRAAIDFVGTGLAATDDPTNNKTIVTVGKYKQFVYTYTTTDLTFLTDSAGAPLFVLSDLE